MSSEITAYKSALEDCHKADADIATLAKFLQSAASTFSQYPHFASVINLPQGTVSACPHTPPNHSLDATTWPTIETIANKIAAYRRARETCKAAYAAIPEDIRSMVSPRPPS